MRQKSGSDLLGLIGGITIENQKITNSSPSKMADNIIIRRITRLDIAPSQYLFLRPDSQQCCPSGTSRSVKMP